MVTVASSARRRRKGEFYEGRRRGKNSERRRQHWFALKPVHLFAFGLLAILLYDVVYINSSGWTDLLSWHRRGFTRRPMQIVREISNCECIRCTTDLQCGGLWNGEVLPNSGSNAPFTKLAVVVSHCLHPLNWLKKFLKFRRRSTIHSITIYSKCNQTVVGAPAYAKVIRLPNVGRCDHSYAHWIKENYKQTSSSPDAVVFLKDSRSEENIHQAGVWTSLRDMLRTAAVQGFACGMRPTTIDREGTRFYLSAYHDTAALMKFAKKEYVHQAEIYNATAKAVVEPFESVYINMGAWVDGLGLPVPRDLMQDCYGGTFAVKMEAIYSNEYGMWQTLVENLARGDNIEEGHFAERAWAALLAIPPTPYEIMLLRRHSEGLANYADSYVGTLKREVPKESQ